MPILGYIIVSTLVISCGALLGAFSLFFKKEVLDRIIFYLISLSAGTLMGGAFLHLIPEATERFNSNLLFPLILFSFIIFFFIEKILHWQHCHEENCEIHTFGHMALIGNSVHNFIDGLIIAATFLADVKLGMATTLAIASHAIPQEIGNFGVFLYAGYKKTKALIVNFLVSLVMVAGGVGGYLLVSQHEKLIAYLLPFAAGGFLYISTSDLIPEIRKEKDIKKSLISFAFFILGILIIYFARLIE